MPRPKTMKAGSPDDFQTDSRALDCLIPYLPLRMQKHMAAAPEATMIWEPACGKGNLVRRFDELGFGVIGTDILTGTDFLKDEPKNYHYNCIITNPPFSLKEQFMGRCYQLRKPFALLMPITTFDSKKRRQLMNQHGVQIIFPEGRIQFETPNHGKRVAAGKKPGESWFYTAWFTWGLKLPHDLVFCDPETLSI